MNISFNRLSLAKRFVHSTKFSRFYLTLLLFYDVLRFIIVRGHHMIAIIPKSTIGAHIYPSSPVHHPSLTLWCWPIALISIARCTIWCGTLHQMDIILAKSSKGSVTNLMASDDFGRSCHDILWVITLFTILGGKLNIYVRLSVKRDCIGKTAKFETSVAYIYSWFYSYTHADDGQNETLYIVLFLTRFNYRQIANIYP